MRIGIISSYAFIKSNNNYGALLQYYALQNYLKKKGHESFWIRSVLENEKPFICIRLLKKLRSIKLVLNWYHAHRGFVSFISKYLNVTPKEYKGFIQLKNEPPLADVYITGSDQVWGSADLMENYLLFAPEDKRHIAYAASFGRDQISEEMQNKITPWLKKFSAISVREKSGVDICHKMGIEAITLIDPTLLLNLEDYPSSSISRINRPYVYCYFLNVKYSDSVLFDSLEQVAASINKELLVCAVQGSECLFNNSHLVAPTPEQWLTDYRHADYVITNTFHGTVFALINHKPFVTILQGGISASQNGRITSILSTFHLENRICINAQDIIKKLKEPIDWNIVESIRAKLIQQANIFFDYNL